MTLYSNYKGVGRRGDTQTVFVPPGTSAESAYRVRSRDKGASVAFNVDLQMKGKNLCSDDDELIIFLNITIHYKLLLEP